MSEHDELRIHVQPVRPEDAFLLESVSQTLYRGCSTLRIVSLDVPVTIFSVAWVVVDSVYLDGPVLAWIGCGNAAVREFSGQLHVRSLDGEPVTVQAVVL